MNDNRYVRYSGILPVDKLQQTTALIIGVGAGGRQVALILSAMGIGGLRLIDPDTVSDVNYGTQGYRPEQLKCYKAHATKADCFKINPNCEIRAMARCVRDMDVKRFSGPIFVCVDSIAVRTEIFNWIVLSPNTLLIDGRMAAETMRALTVYDQLTYDHYKTTLFRQAEAFEMSCTTKSTFYCANVLAALQVNAFSQRLRNIETLPDYNLNLLSLELIPVDMEINPDGTKKQDVPDM